ncbi:ParA family protein [Cellvibrio sp. ARAG 10.3]|uniref:ParA family protein n=1 Tax=Cellvibrio sp. ARAG 10.3 TaxID=3451358 RepID=UPI003F459AE7
MAKIYAVIGTKGGTGKTSTSVNLASIFADMNQKVLLIDTDPAQNLSKYFNIPFPAEAGLTRLVTKADPTGCISQTGFPNLDIILNDDAKGDKGGPILPFLRESSSHIIYLNLALQTLNGEYDYIIIDTQGAGGLVQEAVILAADELISPVIPNYLDSTEFITGTVGLLRSLLPAPGMKTTIAGKPLPPCNAVINKMGRTRDARDVVEHLRKEFDQAGDGLVRVLNTIIPDLAVYNKAAGASEPAHHFEPARPSYSPSAKETMVNLAYELQPKLIGTAPLWEV